MGKKRSTTRPPSRPRRARTETIVVATIAALVLIGLGLWTTLTDSSSGGPNAAASLGTASATPTEGTSTASPTATATEFIDPGLATHFALLTATPIIPATKPTGPPEYPSPEPQPTLFARIDDSTQGPFSPAIFKAVNKWIGTTSDGWMLVYAGAVKNSDGSVGEGALLVFSIETDAAATLLGVEPIGTFAAPSNADPLEIVSVDGDTLTLRTEAGDEFVFDAVTREFVAGP